MNRSLVPAKSNSYYQAFNVKSLFGEIDCPKKSQVKLKEALFVVIDLADKLSSYSKDFLKSLTAMVYSSSLLSEEGDRVLRSNSHGKKLEIEEHRRNVMLPKNKMSITACNDSLNAKTVNVKSVSAMCAKSSINGKKYVLVIVDDYSRYTWTHFLRSKDETPEVLIDFLRLVQRGLQAQVRVVRTDKGTEFMNQALLAYFAAEGIQHQTDGENLDKMKEKGDESIFVGYSTQSRADRVYNKRKRVIMESIHVNFDELPSMASVQNSSDPVPTRQSMASVHNSSDPAPTCQKMASVQISSDPAPESQVPSVQTLPSFPQQSPCCEDSGVTHEPYQSIAITFDLPTVEPKDSLRMGDEHLDTILETESNEFIKSSVENLVPNRNESEDLSDSKCDVPACDDFTTFSNLLFDADDDFSYSDNESASLYVEFDLIESLLNQDSSIISSSSKIDSLLDEFAGELILLKSIPPGIDETDCDPEEEIRLIEKLLSDNLSPHPLEEFISENSDAAIEYFSPSHIPVEDSDSLMKEIDLTLTPDDSMPSGIKNDDYDSEGDILIRKELLSINSLSLPENESFDFDIQSSSHPPTKPLDVDEIKPNLGILTVKVVGDIYEQKLDDDLWREKSYLGCCISPFLSPLTSSSMGEPGQAEQPKQALRGRHPMLILLNFVLQSSLPQLQLAMDIKERDKIKAKTGQNQARNGKRGKVNQVKVKSVKTGHGFGKSTKNQS
nr:integrase, catalytic region, zinc finger, CCHC-type, peptidase aspartic, catalytic [Tanacetum cinerariifolium]